MIYPFQVRHLPFRHGFPESRPPWMGLN